MLVRAKKIDATAEELNTLLLEDTDNGVIDTLPEVFEYLQNGGGGGGSGCTINSIPDSDIDIICT